MDIVYAPLFLALLSKDLFVTPPFADIMPPLNADVSSDTYDALSFLAHSFRKYFDSVNARVEIYSIGQLSDYLAENLEKYGVDADRKDVSSER